MHMIIVTDSCPSLDPTTPPDDYLNRVLVLAALKMGTIQSSVSVNICK